MCVLYEYVYICVYTYLYIYGGDLYSWSRYVCMCIDYIYFYISPFVKRAVVKTDSAYFKVLLGFAGTEGGGG